RELIAIRKDREEKNDLLLALLEASVHGIFAVDSDWRIIALNKQFYSMWNLEDAISIGDDGWKVLMSHCMTQVVDPKTFISNCCTPEGVPDAAQNNHLYLPNGKILKSFFAPIIGSDGTEHGKIWEFTDITDDVAKQEELEETHSMLIQKSLHLALALENAGEGLWTWDTRTDLFLLNPEFASQHHSICEVQSIDEFFQSVPSSEREQCLNVFRDITGRCSIKFELHLQSNEGTWRCFILRGIVSEVDNDGAPLTATGTLVDITDQKLYEKHLREANREMATLSKITCHDIMNQLSILFGVSEALSDNISDAETKALLEILEETLVATKEKIELQRDYQELGVHGEEWQEGQSGCLLS
ncbi:MAG: PAS domain-containing protein, partial [Euryarchaeota archaeon]|nr:PAS domain-containing protein [Euryarchaeota archaeon]